MIKRVRKGIQDLLDEECSISYFDSLRTILADDLLTELFGSWVDASVAEPHGRQLIDILRALGVRSPRSITILVEDSSGIDGEVEASESLREVSSVVVSIDAGQAAQDRRGHGGSGHEDLD